MEVEHWWNDPDIWRKTCPSATLSTKNPIYTGLGLNPDLPVSRVVTICLSHGKGSVYLP